jgi:WD40 repeat protein
VSGAVLAVTAVPLPDGRTVIASGSGDQTVRLWDPVTGQPVVDPLTLFEPVAALTEVEDKVAAAAGRAIVMLAMAPATSASTGVGQSDVTESDTL